MPKKTHKHSSVNVERRGVREELFAGLAVAKKLATTYRVLEGGAIAENDVGVMNVINRFIKEMTGVECVEFKMTRVEWC